MKAYHAHEPTGADGLRLVDLPEPTPNSRQILVRLRAASLNARDMGVVYGRYPVGISLPVIPLSDGAGEVVAVGDDVQGFRPGDRVAGTFFQDWTAGPIKRATMNTALGGLIDGVLTEYKLFAPEGLVQLPNNLSFEEGACLPCAGVTAWHALVSQGNLGAGDSVLLLGTGGVSMFALQFAKAHGARVIITSSSDAKLEKARQLGADDTINYRQIPNWADRVLELTGGEGVDHVVEVGGGGTLANSVASVRPNGRISLIGVASGQVGELNPMSVFLSSLTVQGIYVGSQEMFQTMNRAILVNDLHPVIDRVYAFDEAPEAFRHLQRADHQGKVVIRIGAE